MKCMAKGCANPREWFLPHPFGGEVKLCAKHYNIIKEAQDALILQWLADTNAAGKPYLEGSV